MTRYERQIALPEIGIEGQMKFQQARVLIVGVGGLGSPIALYLAAAGIGTLGLIDQDVVGISNLQRQILYTEEEVGKPKVFCAAKRLQAMNPKLKVETFVEMLTKENAAQLINNYDVIVDGCDNFMTRYLLNDTCLTFHKPYVYGAIQEFDGQVSVFGYGSHPHSYRELYPDEEEMKATPAIKSVIGTTPAITGSIQANEVLKIIGGYGEVLSGKLWTINLLTLQTNLFNL